LAVVVKGALNVCEPPQELVTVRVPVVGGETKVTVPETLYWLFPGLHALGVAVKLVMSQGVTRPQSAIPEPPVWLNVIKPAPPL